MREDYRSLFLDGKDMAMAFDCKFIDTSCVLKHNVDELLVGVTKQVLLRKEESSMGGNSRNGTQSRVNCQFFNCHLE